MFVTWFSCILCVCLMVLISLCVSSYSQRINSKCENTEIWLNVTYMSYRSRRFGIDIVIQIYCFWSIIQTHFKPIIVQSSHIYVNTNAMFEYVFSLLILVLCVSAAAAANPKRKHIRSMSTQKGGKKCSNISWKKNAVASRLMYPIWWNDKLKKFACVCMGVLFFSLLF